VIHIKYNEIYHTNKEKFFGHVPDIQWNDWKWQIRNGIRNFDDLIKYFPLLEKNREKLLKTNFFITPYFLSLIDLDRLEMNKNKMKIYDPIARQVIPSVEEFSCNLDEKTDPFSEFHKSPLTGCVKRYKDRILILPTNICAGYCRYCTRKWNWNSGYLIKREDIKNIKKYIGSNPSIREVIISGGDPFLIPVGFLDELIYEMISIDTVEVIRIATRLPAFLPQRINREISGILKKYKSLWVITHFNHPDEITPATQEAVENLMAGNAALANQTVMLKGVNDGYEILKKLFYSLESLRIKPYYIFHCDPVKGTSHFKVPLKSGLKLMNRLRRNISGLSIPLYVMDLPGKGKIPVTDEIIR
jgi:lysine 2,3-aminomutase